MWIKDKPQSIDPPKISPWVSNKGGIELIKSVHRDRLKTISKAILPQWQLGVMVPCAPHLTTAQVSQSMALFIGLCNQTARRAGAAGLRNKWSQSLKCHLLSASSASSTSSCCRLASAQLGICLPNQPHIYHQNGAAPSSFSLAGNFKMPGDSSDWSSVHHVPCPDTGWVRWTGGGGIWRWWTK